MQTKIKWIISKLNKNYIPNLILLVVMLSYSFLLLPDRDLFYRIKIALATFLFALCLFGINKWLFRTFLIFLGLLAAIYFPIIDFFGPLSVSNVESFLVTDYKEVRSYFSIIPARFYLFAFLLLLVPVLLCVLTFKFYSRKASLVLITLFLGLSFSKRYLLSRLTYTSVLEGTFNIIPMNIIGQVYQFYTTSMEGFRYQAQLLRKKDDWVIDRSVGTKELYFVIIGESVRRDIFSNPNLYKQLPFDSIPKITFENMISYAYITIPSLENAFVLRKDGEGGKPYFPDNVVNLARKAGIHTEWLSNQGSVGVDDNYVSAIAKCADHLDFLNSDKEWSEERKSDTLLLSILKERLRKTGSGNNLFFIHTIGSHPSACYITKGKYDKFVLSDEVSCYIKTVEDTKDLIYKIYKIAENSGKSFKIVYFSDHGLTYDYKDKLFVHYDFVKENYEIPFIILSDDLSKSVNIKANRNLGDFINFFQEFTGITSRNAKYDYRFVSEDSDKTWNHLYGGLDYNNFSVNPMPFNQR